MHVSSDRPPSPPVTAVDERVFIVMATYQGAAYVAEQISSLQAQTFSNWTLLVNDDGSSDATPQILAQCAGQDPRIVVLQAPVKRLGPARNFGFLLEQAQARNATAVFCADQDDVWRSDKLAVQLAALAKLEQQHDSQTPALVFSDLELVDAGLGTIRPSFIAHIGVQPGSSLSLPQVLTQNCGAGCTMLLNRALLDVVLPMPQAVVVHDWWIAVCAAALGVSQFVPEPLVRYRQHQANSVGATHPGQAVWKLLTAWQQRFKIHAANFSKGIAQVPALQQRCEASLCHATNPQRRIVSEYSKSLIMRSRWRRAWNAWRLGVRPQGKLKAASYIVHLVFLSKSSKVTQTTISQ